MAATIKVLTVEDDDDDADLLAFALEQTAERDYELRRARSLNEMHRVLASFQPDIVLLDLHLPDCHGLETVRQAALAVRDAPILVLTGRADGEIGLRAVEAGAQDFLPKPEMMSPILKRAIDFAIQRKGIVRATEKRAATDALTGLANRAAFTRELETATAQADRHGGGFALAFIDLDGFKGINDTRGHAAGDEVLVAVAARIWRFRAPPISSAGWAVTSSSSCWTASPPKIKRYMRPRAMPPRSSSRSPCPTALWCRWAPAWAWRAAPPTAAAPQNW